MNILYKRIGVSLMAIFSIATVKAQCPTISCLGDTTINVDAGTCGSVFNYTAPIGVDLCAAGGNGNILFVSDGSNAIATEIPAELTAAGYTVTTVYDDHDGTTDDNTVLQGAGLDAYDAIYWHASGSGGYGDLHTAATFANLTTYVNGGGAIFITGYDVIASPTDNELITFMGGTTSTDGGSQGTETLVGANSLTTGVSNIVGLTLATTGDHDGLNNLQPGTVGVAVAASGSAGWSIRTLGAGEIAWVSSTQSSGAYPAWSTPGSGYHEAVLNFAFNHSCTGGNILFVSDGANTTATEIPAELIAAGYNVTEVYDDHDGTTDDNTVLQGAGLDAYDAIYWHASGSSGYGDLHTAATFANLTTYVNNGGALFITGYDVIASPTDNELITFMGGTTSTDGGSQGTETLVGANSLTTGVTNIVGLTLASTGDHDGLNNLQPGTVGVAVAASGSAGWSIRTLGSGEIAWVSSANYVGQPWAAWNTPGSGYQEALVNFAMNHTCGPNVGSPVTTMTAGLASGSTFPVGQTTVTFEVVDGQGNNAQQCSFIVTVVDNEAPTADVATLTDEVAECSSTPVAPTSTDNCTGSVVGTPDVTFPITAQGTTVVTWTYDDGNGNTSTQTQNVVITDVTAPLPDFATLTDEVAECSSTPVAPTSTDNCAGSIVGTPDVTFPITAQGTTVVTWTYDDGNGNTSTQTQNVVLTDVTNPVADIATLADVTEVCSSSPVAPTAMDNCSGSLIGVADVTFPITTEGTTVVTWTYDDGNGNMSTQTQNVIISGVEVGVTQAGATLTADASGVTYQWLDCDNGNAVIPGETNVSFVPTAVTGNYAVEITDGSCVDTSMCYNVDYTGIEELMNEDLLVYPNPSKGLFTIESKSNYISEILIMDNSGRIVYNTKELNGKSQAVNLLDVSSGVYFVKVVTDFGVSVREIILE